MDRIALLIAGATETPRRPMIKVIGQLGFGKIKLRLKRIEKRMFDAEDTVTRGY